VCVCVCVCVCAYACVRGRKKERERVREEETAKEREQERKRVCVRVCGKCNRPLHHSRQSMRSPICTRRISQEFLPELLGGASEHESGIMHTSFS